MKHIKELVHSRPAAAGGEHRPSLVASACWRNEHLVRVKEMDSALFPFATRRRCCFKMVPDKVSGARTDTSLSIPV